MKNKVSRFERKWVYSNNDHLVLVNALIRSNFFFCKQYPNRKVNSIYFDDINYSSILENLDGVSKKKKIRVRWYGEENKLINPILEIKRKKGFVTNKESYQINELNELKFNDYKNLDLIKNTVNLKSKIKLLFILYSQQIMIGSTLFQITASLELQLIII